MNRQHRGQTDKPFAESKVSKAAVVAAINNLEQQGIKPTVRAVREAMGGTTASVSQWVTQINQERETTMQQAISDELMSLSNKLFETARRSAIECMGDQLSEAQEHVARVNAENEKLRKEVDQLSGDLGRERIARAASEQVCQTESAAKDAALTRLVEAEKKLAQVSHDHERMSEELAQEKQQVIDLDRQLKTAHSTESQLRDRLDHLSAEVQTAKGALANAQDTNDREIRAHENTRSDKAKVDLELADTKREMQKLLDERSALERQKSEMAEAVERARCAYEQERGKTVAVTQEKQLLAVRYQHLMGRVKKNLPDIAAEFEDVEQRLSA